MGEKELHKAVFIDRDGVIIEDDDYLSDMDAARFIPGSIDALRTLTGATSPSSPSDAGWKIIIVTNQSGIARGYFSEDRYHIFTAALLSRLSDEMIRVDGVYYCPHHPTEGVGPYRIDCDCRKPKTGMIMKGAGEHSVDLAASWLVGDKASDIKAGRDSGTRTILVKTGYGGSDVESGGETGAERGPDLTCPDFTCDDLAAAVDLILADSIDKDN